MAIYEQPDGESRPCNEQGIGDDGDHAQVSKRERVAVHGRGDPSLQRSRLSTIREARRASRYGGSRDRGADTDRRPQNHPQMRTAAMERN